MKFVLAVLALLIVAFFALRPRIEDLPPCHGDRGAWAEYRADTQRAFAAVEVAAARIGASDPLALFEARRAVRAGCTADSPLARRACASDFAPAARAWYRALDRQARYAQEACPGVTSAAEGAL
ncbi:MAG: hypothetical protein H6702_05410 [Myxococcales bacterium]|nr:hypothetical protein [Myxococcales bacterium]